MRELTEDCSQGQYLEADKGSKMELKEILFCMKGATEPYGSIIAQEHGRHCRFHKQGQYRSHDALAATIHFSISEEALTWESSFLQRKKILGEQRNCESHDLQK